MENKSTLELTEAQFVTIRALSEMEGWASSYDLQVHGGNPASAAALVDKGVLKHRLVTCKKSGNPKKEWSFTQVGRGLLQ